jgi:hypothetical protein
VNVRNETYQPSVALIIENGDYRQYKTLVTFVFDVTKSGGRHPDSDIITSVNIPFKAVQGKKEERGGRESEGEIRR